MSCLASRLQSANEPNSIADGRSTLVGYEVGTRARTSSTEVSSVTLVSPPRPELPIPFSVNSVSEDPEMDRPTTSLRKGFVSIWFEVGYSYKGSAYRTTLEGKVVSSEIRERS